MKRGIKRNKRERGEQKGKGRKKKARKAISSYMLLPCTVFIFESVFPFRGKDNTILVEKSKQKRKYGNFFAGGNRQVTICNLRLLVWREFDENPLE
ncbi:MAG: hypothetical protein ACI36X_07030 [Bacteroidaceae bacterium]